MFGISVAARGKDLSKGGHLTNNNGVLSCLKEDFYSLATFLKSNMFWSGEKKLFFRSYFSKDFPSLWKRNPTDRDSSFSDFFFATSRRKEDCEVIWPGAAETDHPPPFSQFDIEST